MNPGVAAIKSRKAITSKRRYSYQARSCDGALGGKNKNLETLKRLTMMKKQELRFEKINNDER